VASGTTRIGDAGNHETHSSSDIPARWPKAENRGPKRNRGPKLYRSIFGRQSSSRQASAAVQGSTVAAARLSADWSPVRTLRAEHVEGDRNVFARYRRDSEHMKQLVVPEDCGRGSGRRRV
jgi:hypothetical protein